ncbi:type I restriction-modification enzyme, S subunit [Paraliobacillus quinghaiensis]|uniref:Type I restriction-modification enzyme, S subunit n=1 Tax=Paraliobacillus quinghaiensis TaxID=470815 RepID=A0A917TLY7_9BACI|nr:restriction endonuclease subunit S [Paraliobacillus quinghaiensis]GGM28207.1 type I restriction-modification enzyme, S subunit [Paraliobacillus quinghaiensis]
MGKMKSSLTPQGYKKLTVPEDWLLTPLYEVRDSNDRYSFTGGPFGSDLKTKDYQEEGVRIVQLQNIGDGKFLDNYKIYTSEEKANELLNSNIYPGDIIIAKMAEPLARACFIPNINSRLVMASDGIRLKVDKERFDERYILYYINSKVFRNEAIRRGSGTTRLRIGLSELKSIPIAHPNYLEQKKIADILTTWDKAIDLNEQLIVQRKDQKKWSMQKLLTGEVRLQGFDGEWADVKIKDIAKIYLGLTYTPSYEPNGVPFLSVKDINGGKINFNNVKYISKDEYESSTANAKPKRGDILFGRVGTLGNPVIITEDIDFCIFVSLGFLRMLDDNIYNYYIKYWMSSNLFKRQVDSLIAGSSQKNLNTGWLKEFKLKLPPIEEQKAIASLLLNFDKEIELREKEREQLQQQKKGLMQLLLTGKVRVKV